MLVTYMPFSVICAVSASHSASLSSALMSLLAQVPISQRCEQQSVRLDSNSSQNQWISQCSQSLSMSFICAPCSAALIALGAIRVSQKVMSEWSQISKSVIRSAIKINIMRPQRKVRSTFGQGEESQARAHQRLAIVAKIGTSKGI
eukprot:1658270-Amphidinium_carterae.2